MLVALAVMMSAAGQPGDLLFHLPLDDTLQPAVGASAPRVEGQARFEAGRVGRALLVGDGACELALAIEGNVRVEAGSVAMWVQPVDWSGDDEKFHVFFEAKTPGWLLLYKYLSPATGLLLLLSDDTQAHGWQVVGKSIRDWKPGEWHHLAATWDSVAAVLYVDGVATAPVTDPPVPRIEADTVLIGDRPWHVERDARSLIDEVYVFGRPLEAEEVAALHAAGAAGQRPSFPLAELAPLRVHMQPGPGRERWVVSLNLAGLTPEQRARARVHAQLLRPDGSQAWQGDVRPVEGHRAATEAPMQMRPAGVWKVVARVEVDGRQLGRAEATAEIPDTWWEGNDLFEAVELLPPWTPLVAEPEAVQVWGRRYQLSPVGPAALENQGRELLSGPCRLEARVDGKTVTAEGLTLRAGESTDAWAEYEGRGRLGPVRLSSRVRAEFDGMVRFDVTFEPEGEAQLEELRWVLPVRAEAATLVHYPGTQWRGSHGGAVPQGDGIVWQERQFSPFLWVGDEDAGVMWFGESEQGWSRGKEQPCMYLRRGDGAVELLIEPVAQLRALTGPWTWTYGVMATPVKPLPGDWRKWRLEPGRQANVSIVWPTPKTIKYFGYPWPAEAEEYRKMVAAKHERGVKVVPYSCLTFLSEASPEWGVFGKEWWVTGVADRTSGDVGAYNCGFMAVCPGAQGWADFAVAANKRYMETFDLDGLYHDNTFLYACANELHGHGWQEEGSTTRQRVYPVFAHRHLYRRVYAMMKGLGRETYMMAHMSGRVNMPVLSFVDAYLDGEHFRDWVDDDYRKVVSLEEFRAEFMGRQWGLMPVFLPELAEEARKTREPTRQMLSMTVLHDTPVWAIWCSAVAVDEVRKALDDFGYVDAGFLGYWQQPVGTDHEDVKVSAYVRDGRALLVVSNLAYEARTVTLVPDGDRLGLEVARAAARDAETGEALGGAGEPIRLTVPPGDLRLVLLSPAE